MVVELKKPAIELIPWIHDFDLLAHGYVIDFVRTLPKNSAVALELSHEDVVGAMQLSDILSGKTIEFGGKKFGGEQHIKAIIENYPSSVWAGIELIHECRKRNLRIISLKTGVLSKKGRKSGLSVGDSDFITKQTRTDEFFEKTFAEQLAKQSIGLKQEKIPAIVGIAHLTNLQQELQKKGFVVSQNLGIIKDAHTSKVIKNFGIANLASRKFLADGRLENATSMVEIGGERLLQAKSRQNPQLIKNRIVLELQTKTAQQGKRIELKKTRPKIRSKRTSCR